METREEHYASMMQAVQRYAPSADLEEIQKAYEYADRKHKNQLRKSGEPYIIHPLAVAEIVAEIGLDTDAIVATLHELCRKTRRKLRRNLPHVRADGGRAGRGRHEAHARAVHERRRTADGEHAQDAPGHGQGHHASSSSRSPTACTTRAPCSLPDASQSSASKSLETMEIYAPHRAPPRHAEDQVGSSKTSRCSTSTPTGYQADHRTVCTISAGRRAQNFMGAIQSTQITRPAGRRRRPRARSTSRVKHIVHHLPQDARAEARQSTSMYDLCAFPRHRRQRSPTATTSSVIIHDLYNPLPGPLQGLHQQPRSPTCTSRVHTTVIGSAGHPLRGADPHLGDAPDGGVRRRGALEIQDRQRRAHEARRRGEVRLGPPPARERSRTSDAARLYPQL